jgi:glycine/D-amino acid oxidase-like deaminating enzyme
MDPIKVAVVGGGLGGLCLANGLLKAGADVTVYERDASLAGRRQGYRLHLDARAGLALQQCLPPPSLELFQASCARPSRRMTAHRLSGELTRYEAVADYETQMRAYGYQAVAASSQAEAEMGARRGKLAFWLYRRLAKGPA